MVIATNETEQRPRPTNPLLRALTYGVNRDNIESRFKDLVKQLFRDYLVNDCDGLTTNDIERIRDGDMDITESVINGFVRVVNADECDDGDMDEGTMTWGVGEYLIEIIGNRDENPLYFIDPNALDEIPIFITTTKSVILEHTSTEPMRECQIGILIEYIGSIMYWFGLSYLVDWGREELLRRMIQNHDENIADDDVIEISDCDITDEE